MSQIQREYEKALTDFKKRVVEKIGDRIESIVVYGSVARGEAIEDSDIDVLIVGTDKEIGSMVSEIGYDVDYENGFKTFITPILFTKEELEERVKVGSPFVYKVLRDGVALHDDGTFKRVRKKVLEASG